MINVLDTDSAEKIVQLERALGWPDNIIGKEWAKEVEKEIVCLRKALDDGEALRTLSPDGQIYGQGGYDRFFVRPDGEIVFGRNFCTHMDQDMASQQAIKLGFSVQ